VALLPVEREALLGRQGAQPQLSRDEEVLAHLVADGRSSREIAQRLHLSKRTVERRSAHLRQRLGAATTAELMALLIRHGFGS
jgi:DNA-binding NarL/FixJ family response regulator